MLLLASEVHEYLVSANKICSECNAQTKIQLDLFSTRVLKTSIGDILQCKTAFTICEYSRISTPNI